MTSDFSTRAADFGGVDSITLSPRATARFSTLSPFGVSKSMSTRCAVTVVLPESEVVISFAFCSASMRLMAFLSAKRIVNFSAWYSSRW